MVRTTSQDKMKIKNYTKILELVMANPGIHRKKVSHLAHLSNQTLSNLVKELIDFGYLCEFSLEESVGFGRRPIALKVNYQAFFIISIEMTSNSLEVFLNACDGTVVWHSRQYLDKNSAVLQLLKEGIEEALKNTTNKVFAIVISAEGIIDEEHKKLSYVKALSLEDVDLGKELATFGIPLFLINDTNLICNYVMVNNPKLLNFMVVKLDAGIGCSIALNRHIQKTSENNMPGKLGHLKVMNTDENNICWCGGTNCLSTFLSKDFIEQRFTCSYEDALQRIRDGEVSGYSAMITDCLAPILANITTLLGIEKIFACGKMVEVFGKHFIQALDGHIAPAVPFWINYLGMEDTEIPSIPNQCSSFFMHYFLQHILEYLEAVEESPFT